MLEKKSKLTSLVKIPQQSLSLVARMPTGLSSRCTDKHTRTDGRTNTHTAGFFKRVKKKQPILPEKPDAIEREME